jgi:hypothetical protein
METPFWSTSMFESQASSRTTEGPSVLFHTAPERQLRAPSGVVLQRDGKSRGGRGQAGLGRNDSRIRGHARGGPEGHWQPQ